jgi:hypothetical protein
VHNDNVQKGNENPRTQHNTTQHSTTQHNKISSFTTAQGFTHPVANHSMTFQINFVIIKMATIQKPISRQKGVS